jgi:hypothetical protein
LGRRFSVLEGCIKKLQKISSPTDAQGFKPCLLAEAASYLRHGACHQRVDLWRNLRNPLASELLA